MEPTPSESNPSLSCMPTSFFVHGEPHASLRKHRNIFGTLQNLNKKTRRWHLITFEHRNPHYNRLEWVVVHLPQNNTIGFDPQPFDSLDFS